MAELVGRLAEFREFAVSQFDAAEEYLERAQPDQPGCMVAEAELPGMGGIELLQRLRAAGISLPVVIVSSRSDVVLAVRAMKAGAVDFFPKPCDPAGLWKVIQDAIENDRMARQRAAVRRRILCCLERITAEEKQVMQMVLEGESNRTIAHHLRLSVRTIDFRRASILRKMEARSLIELAQMLTVVDQSLPSRWNSSTDAELFAVHAAGESDFHG